MTFANDLNGAVRRMDGIAVARLVSILNPKLAEVAMSTNAAMLDSTIRAHIKNKLWQDIATSHWHVAFNIIQAKDLKQAAVEQNKLLTALNRMAEKTDNWVLPVMYSVARELRQIALMADKQETDNKKNGANEVNDSGSTPMYAGEDAAMTSLELSTRVINRSFTICLNDRTPELELSKKWGVYFFLSELVKIYFKLDKQPLAKNVIKVRNAMENDLPALEQYPRSHQVTFLYYWGVLLFIDQSYIEAEETLARALKLCYKTSRSNQEQILLYLIPARLLTGKQIPSKKLYQEFPRLAALYQEPLRAMRTGNVGRVKQCLKHRQSVYVKRYLYLAMEQIVSMSAGWCVARAYKFTGQGNRLNIRQVEYALRYAGYFDDENAGTDDDKEDRIKAITKAGPELEIEAEAEMDTETKTRRRQEKKDQEQLEDRLDESECILATMISRGEMRGYISHERRIVVLSNKDPFPRRVLKATS